MLSRASLLFQATTATQQATSVRETAALPKPSDSVSVKVSSQAADLAKQATTVNHSRVEELRQRFATGAFSVDRLSLARAMLAQS